jgi:hypothetical protein
MVGEAMRRRQGEPGFADTAGTREGDEPHVLSADKVGDCRKLALPPDQRRRRHREYRPLDLGSGSCLGRGRTAGGKEGGSVGPG